MITLKLNNLYSFEYNGQYQFKDSPGVYAIVNLLNNKKYIGSSSSLRRRYRQHFNDLNKNKHSNLILQRAYNKYGSKHFGFIILETCENVNDTLLFIEQKYINEFGDYNICKIAGKTTGVRNTGHIISEEHKKIISQNNKNRIWNKETLQRKSDIMKNSKLVEKLRKKVIQYSLEGEVIAIHNSIAEAATKIGGINKRVNIKRCCQGKQKTAYNFVWKFLN